MTHLGRERHARARLGILAATAVLATALVTPLATTTVAAQPPEPIPGDRYPFVCTTAREGLGQPDVDNTDGQGIPVVSETIPGPGWASGLSGVSGGDAARPYPNRNGYPDLALYQALGLAPDDATTFAGIDPQPEWLLGHSRDCNLAEPVVDYLYLSNSRADDPATPWVIEGNWTVFDNDDSKALPSNIVYLEESPETVTPGDGKVAQSDQRNVLNARTPFIIRRERGTANGFIYSIAALAPFGEQPGDVVSTNLWNGRVAFHFGGGVGIGHSQGRISSGNALYTQELQRGYAILYSTGTATSHHYNLALGGRTAVATKARFVEVYGEPLYTIGVGGSGGGIQQYVYGQNHPDLLDGGVPQYSYPDMTTQTIHIGDCELLEHYFEKTDAGNVRWQTVENRIPVIGLNAESKPRNRSTFSDLGAPLYLIYSNLGFTVPSVPAGTDSQGSGSIPPLTECRAAWTGLTPSAMNPTFQTISDIDRVEGYDLAEVEFTHWDDAGEVYGYDDDGWARVPWGNVGLQYGLRALTEGRLTPAEFLRLNALVGSWKDSDEQAPEKLPYSAAASGQDTTQLLLAFLLESSPTPKPGETPQQTEARLEAARAEFAIWASGNMNLSPDGVTPAPRRTGDPIAIANAFDSGLVFSGANPDTGDLFDLPVIDWRHYLEEELDMHNSHQSCAARQRHIDARGDADNQLVWFTDGRPARAWDQTPQAFDVMEEWITIMQENPGMSAGEAREAMTNDLATDACFSVNGVLQDSGDGVWSGVLDDEAPGACTERYRVYSTSRIEAGASIAGDSYSCGTDPVHTPLIPVAQAVAEGYYGLWQPTPAQVRRLQEIFPTGVCAYGPFYEAGAAPAPPAVPFTDADPNASYRDGLRWASALGITTGTSPTTFTPRGNVTRGQMAAFLWRFVGEPPSSTPVPFSDVASTPYFFDALRWMVENDLTTVSGSRPSYRPQDTTTRAQVVTFLYRLAGQPQVDSSSLPFTDVPVDAFYRNAVAWAVDQGITEGTSPTTFAPLVPVTRGQLVTFLYRARDVRMVDPAVRYEVTVAGGFGSGSYRPGATVHVWSAVSTTNGVAQRWRGDVDLLAEPDEWHTTFVMPARDVSLVTSSSTQTLPLNTETFNGVTGVAKTVRYHFPPQMRGVVLFSHGTGGSSAFVESTEAFPIALALVADGYGVMSIDAEEAAAGDLNGDGKQRWFGQASAANIDLGNLEVLFDSFEARRLISAETPKFALGMSAGGNFSHLLGTIAATPAAASFPQLRFAAVVSFCADATASKSSSLSTTPSAWYMCAAEDNPEVSNTEARANEAQLRRRGVATDYAEHAPSPLYDERFTRIDGINSTTSAAMAAELRAAGFTDRAGFITRASDEITSAVLADPRSFPTIVANPQVNQVRLQVRVMRAEHAMFANLTRRTIDFLDRFNPTSPP